MLFTADNNSSAVCAFISELSNFAACSSFGHTPRSLPRLSDNDTMFPFFFGIVLTAEQFTAFLQKSIMMNKTETFLTHNATLVYDSILTVHLLPQINWQAENTQQQHPLVKGELVVGLVTFKWQHHFSSSVRPASHFLSSQATRKSSRAFFYYYFYWHWSPKSPHTSRVEGIRQRQHFSHHHQNLEGLWQGK